MTRDEHWEHYDHGADIGVRGVGDSKAAAFEQGALSLTAVITDPGKVRPRTRVEVRCEAPDDELLFVEWLNALVYETAVRGMVFSRFQVQIRDGRLRGSMWGEAIDPSRHDPAVEVKGATLTTLHVGRDDRGRWVAQTVVDV